MSTAFQSDAFQNDAFQVDVAGAMVGVLTGTLPSLGGQFTGIEVPPVGHVGVLVARLPSLIGSFGRPAAKRTYPGPGSGNSIAAFKSV